MAGAEAETSSDEHVLPGGLVYDGFISYSHAADELLAPRLQAGLQRFAKPWWKRRALRIFRDEASLSVRIRTCGPRSAKPSMTRAGSFCCCRLRLLSRSG